jgi:TM2 domain-containing membrane protein YozV
MHCVNHPGTEVKSYCQNCGKPLCEACIRTTATGQILCQECLLATGGDPAKAQWQGVNVPPAAGGPFYPLPSAGPNPAAAAVLGLIPGVGAMYNGQLFKGLIHVVVFAVLVSITDRYMIFLIFVFAWCLYQSFEAFHTAKARRDGLPIPDPFGLNELGSWMNLSSHAGRSAGTGHNTSGVNPPPPPPNYTAGPGASPGASTEPPPTYNAPYTSTWTSGVTPGAPEAPTEAEQPGAYSTPPPYTEPYPGAYPGSYSGQDPYGQGYQGYPPGVIPPIPPVPPLNWRRREPVFAFVLIGLGVLFLLQSMGVVGHVLHYIWPFMLIGMGIWLFVRRMGDTQGGSK